MRSSSRLGPLPTWPCLSWPKTLASLSSLQGLLKAMQQLISSILTGTNVADKHALVKTPKVNMREVLIWQLICGYKLRELGVRAM